MPLTIFSPGRLPDETGRVGNRRRLDGTIDRRPYFVLGVSLTLLKMGLDYLVATRLFGRDWTPFEYAVPNQVTGLLSFPGRIGSFTGRCSWWRCHSSPAEWP